MRAIFTFNPYSFDLDAVNVDKNALGLKIKPNVSFCSRGNRQKDHFIPR